MLRSLVGSEMCIRDRHHRVCSMYSNQSVTGLVRTIITFMYSSGAAPRRAVPRRHRSIIAIISIISETVTLQTTEMCLNIWRRVFFRYTCTLKAKVAVRDCICSAALSAWLLAALQQTDLVRLEVARLHQHRSCRERNYCVARRLDTTRRICYHSSPSWLLLLLLLMLLLSLFITTIPAITISTPAHRSRSTADVGAQLYKLPVITSAFCLDNIRGMYGEHIVICPIAIAYSIGQIIKSVCVCQCVCQCVCPSVSTLTVAFLDRYSQKLAQT